MPTTPVFDYYSGLVLLGDGQHRHFLRIVALAEFAVCNVLRYIRSRRQGLVSTFAEQSSLMDSQPVCIPVLENLRQVVSEVDPHKKI